MNQASCWVSGPGQCIYKGQANSRAGFGDKLKDEISRIVERSLNTISESIIKRTASQTLAQVALQAPPEQPPAPPVPLAYTNGAHPPSIPGTTNTQDTITLAGSPQTLGYTISSTGAGYNHRNGTPSSIAHQTTSNISQQTYATTQESSMPPSHAASLQQAGSTAPALHTSTPYSYGNSQMALTNQSHQPIYANEMPLAEWHQWTQTTIANKPPGSQGDYINSVRTLGGRENSANYQGGQGGPINGLDDVSVMQTLGTTNWPLLQYVPANNAFGGQQYGGQQ